MVCTDVASRGLDLPAVEAVVHLQPPRGGDTYVHRSGRTARCEDVFKFFTSLVFRAGRSGQSVAIVVPSDMGRWQSVFNSVLGFQGERVRKVEDIHALAMDLSQVKT